MLSNAPTDNLYKFLTFLGIALFAFCAWTVTDTVHQAEMQMLDAQMQEVVIKKRLEVYSYKYNLTPSLVESDLSELRKERDALITDAGKVVTEQAKSKLKNYQAQDDADLLWYGQYLGLAMAFLGALAWYCFHQRHQDKQLRYQVKAAKNAAGP